MPIIYEGLIQHTETKEPYEKSICIIPQTVLDSCSSIEPLSYFAVTWAGHYERAYNHTLDSRVFTQESCVQLVTDGWGHLSSGGKKFRVEKGDVFFNFKNVEHAYFADKNDPWSMYWVGFTGVVSEYFLRHLHVSPENPVLRLNDYPQAKEMFSHILSVLGNGYTVPNMLIASAELQYFLSILIGQRFDTATESAISINDVINYMNAQIYENLSLDELADHFDMSKYSLIRKFKKLSGYTPMEYFSRLKIQKACSILLEKTNTVKYTSELLGFENPYYFSQTFKKYTGYSPSYFRENKNFFV